MVIGMQESKNCPVCGSDATWTNHDTCWKIHCSGFCGDFLITTTTINYLKGDALRRLDANDLLREPTTLKTPLTNKILAEYARTKHPVHIFEGNYPGYQSVLVTFEIGEILDV